MGCRWDAMLEIEMELECGARRSISLNAMTLALSEVVRTM